MVQLIPVWFDTLADTPLGEVGAAFSGLGLRVVAIPAMGGWSSVEEELAAGGLQPRRDRRRAAEAIGQLSEYFAGRRRTFELQLDLSAMGDFRRRVTLATAVVPYGEVTSYGALAVAAGHPGAGRAIGNVMATNPLPVVVPCHRVVRADGRLGHYALRALGDAGTAFKALLLHLEGALDEPTGRSIPAMPARWLSESLPQAS